MKFAKVFVVTATLMIASISPSVANEPVQTIDPPRVVNEQVQTIYKILYPPTSTAISDTAFRQLMDDLRHSWPKDMEFLSQRVPQNYFTSAQAAKIVKEMTFGDKQEEAAVMLYPQIVDHGNWFVVEEAITFDSDLQRLRRDITNLYNLSR